MSRNLWVLGAIFLLCAVVMSLLVSLLTTIPTMHLARTYFDTSQSGSLSIDPSMGLVNGILEIGVRPQTPLSIQIDNNHYFSL